MRRTLVLLAALVATSLLGAQPSRAQLPECPDSYVASFDVAAIGGDPAWTAGDIDCREYFVERIDTPDGPVEVRGIGDVNVASTLPPGGIEAIRRGVARAGERMQLLGDFGLWNTTILISRARASPTEPQPRFGYASAWTQEGRSGRGATECHVTLFIQMDYTTDEIQYAVAHELFHCVLHASLDEALLATVHGYGKWWSEGSCEWFAAWTAGPQSRWPRARQFDEAVANHVTMYNMSYRAAIFFYWYHQHHGGPPAILPFLDRMSPLPDAVSQETHMRNALPAEQWLAFAQAYDDRLIRYPGRASNVNFGQRLEGETWNIAQTSAHARTLKSFVIAVGWTDYACGRWDNDVTEANVGVRPDHQTGWSRWPSDIDTRDSATAGRRYRMVGLVVDPGTEVDFQVETERRESCADCLTRTVIDQCVVGRWRHTDGGPLEYLRRNGVPVTWANQTQLVITMNDDGTFSTNSIATDAGVIQPLPHGRTARGTGVGETSALRGRWSAENGELLGCIDSGGVPRGTTVIEMPGATHTSPWSGGVAGTGGATTYTCSDTTFTTSAPTAHGPMNYVFTRETPPPRRR